MCSRCDRVSQEQTRFSSSLETRPDTHITHTQTQNADAFFPMTRRGEGLFYGAEMLARDFRSNPTLDLGKFFLFLAWKMYLGDTCDTDDPITRHEFWFQAEPF